MSEEWTREKESAQRRRAAWGLGILALVAAIVVTLMAFFLGTSDSPDSALPPAPSVPLTTGQVSAPPPSHPRSRDSSTPSTRPSRVRRTRHPHHPHHRHHRRHRHHRSSAPRPNLPPTGGRVSCPSGHACVAPGDIGNVMGALNAFRAKHGRPPASATVTPAAQRCALGSGDGSACPTSYFWEPVTGKDGRAVISKIADGGDGVSFLLDPKGRFEVGWAYEPGSHLYECALVTG